jgi:hypothetical protein
MKWFRRILLGVVALVIVVLVIVWFSLDHIVKTKVEANATDSMNLKTTLGGAHLALFGGKVNLSGLEIASPPGFSAPHMLTLGETNVAVRYGQLRQDPIHVDSLTLNKPVLVIENVGGKMNFKAAMDQMPKTESTSNKEPMKLVIDLLQVQDATVVVRPGLPGLPQELTVPVPSIAMRNVGSGDGSQNGAAIKDVAMQVISAMAASASEQGGIPEQLKALLHVNVGQVVSQLSSEAQKRIAAAVPGDIGKALSQAVQDPAAFAKDPVNTLKQGVGDRLGSVLGGNASTPAPATQPAVPGSASEAVDALQGLLNKPKKKDKSR